MLDVQLRSICFDCTDPATLVHFWSEVLGYKAGSGDSINPPDSGPNIWFNQVPERKQVKNRVHIDVNLQSRDDVERLVQLGARILRTDEEVPGESWFIMADPEDNEFCAFPPGT